MNRRMFVQHALSLAGASALGGCDTGIPASKQRHRSEARGLMRFVSLRVLQQGLMGACHHLTCTPDALLHLAGLGRVIGFSVDREHGDVLLMGRPKSARHPDTLHTTDLVVALRSATYRYLDEQRRFSHPGVTIVPQAQTIERLMHFDSSHFNGEGARAQRAEQSWASICEAPQSVMPIGLTGDAISSHYLGVCEIADEKMKSYVDGKINLDGLEVPSKVTLARYEQTLRSGKSPSIRAGFAMSRYWFNAGTVRCSVTANAAALIECQVKLSTEAQMLSRQELVDSGRRDELADNCAASFTRLLPDLARKDPVYADLRQIYRIQSIAVALRQRKAFELGNLDWTDVLDHWKHPLQAVPTSIPGRWTIARGDFEVERKDGRLISKVRIPSCGGVMVNPQPEMFKAGGGSSLDRLQLQGLAARPDTGALYWDVTLRPEGQKA